MKQNKKFIVTKETKDQKQVMATLQDIYENKLIEEKFDDNLNSIEKEVLLNQIAEGMMKCKENVNAKNKRKQNVNKKAHVEKRFKKFLENVTFKALAIEEKYKEYDAKEIKSKIREFYTECYKQGLINYDMIASNKYDLVQSLFNLYEQEGTTININVTAAAATPEEKPEVDVNSDAAEEPSTDDVEDVASMDAAEEPPADETKEEETPEEPPADETKEEETPEEEPEEKEPETPEEKKEDQAAKESAEIIKGKVQDVLMAEKQEAAKRKKIEDAVKSEDCRLVKPSKYVPTLFSSIMINSQKNLLLSKKNLYTENKNEFMQDVFKETVIQYTILETLNTFGIIPSDREFVKRIAFKFAN